MTQKNHKPIMTADDAKKLPIAHKRRFWKYFWLLLLVVIVGLAFAMLYDCNGKGETPQPLSPVDSIDVSPADTTIHETDSVNQSEISEKPNDQDKSLVEVQTTTDETSEDINIVAKQTIRGDFGNGIARRNNLGSKYEQVQEIVNDCYKRGDLFW